MNPKGNNDEVFIILVLKQDVNMRTYLIFFEISNQDPKVSLLVLQPKCIGFVFTCFSTWASFYYQIILNIGRKVIEKLGRLYVLVKKGMTFAIRNTFGGIIICSYDLIKAIAKALRLQIITLIFIHCQNLMKSMDSNGSQLLQLMMKAMV